MSLPAKIGRYEIVSEIGRGAMGVVYDAVDPVLERVVAIKTINMALDPGEMAQYEKRFNVEARAAGGLNHPNIVTIYDIGRSGDLAYMAMEFLEGRELKDLIEAKALSINRALDIAAQVADGLAYAHERGIVHRDIKPANIMILNDGRVKITDFGIARMRSAEVRTQTGVVLGSPRYLSPEQVLGKGGDARIDIFSLGVILYEMISGQPPFKGADVNALMYQIVNFDPPPPSTINATLPPMLDLIVAKALAKKADERYGGIGELAVDLRACRAQSLTSTSTTVRIGPAPPEPDKQSSDILSATIPLPRIEDLGAALPARGLAKDFDSLEATLRLAVQSGAIADPQAFEATFALRPGALAGVDLAQPGAMATSANRTSAVPPWSVRERTVFLGCVVAATALGAVIVVI